MAVAIVENSHTMTDHSLFAHEVRVVFYSEITNGMYASITSVDDGDGFNPMTVKIDESDGRLLNMCGVGFELGESDTYYYTEEDRPLVHIERSGTSSYRIVEVWDAGNSCFRTKEEAMAAIQTSKPSEVQKEGQAFHDAIKRKSDEFMKKIVEQREADGLDPLAGEELQRAKADVLLQVSEWTNQQALKFGKLQIATLWTLRQSGTMKLLPEAPQRVVDVVSMYPQNYGENIDYVKQMARVVDRILPDVEAAYKIGNPFTHPETGEIITVDYILEYAKIKSLHTLSGVWETLPSVEDKREYLEGSFIQSTEALKALVAENSKVTINDRIPTQVVPDPKHKGFRTITMRVNDPQYIAVMKLLGNIVEVVQ